MEGYPEEEDEVDNIQGTDATADLKIVKGIGMGLYTAYQLVKLMGGKLRQSADATANEACFWFSLPLETLVNESGSGQGTGSTVQRSCSKTKPKVTFATLSAFDQGVEVGVGLALVSRQTSFELNAAPSVTMRVLVVDDSAICQKVGKFLYLNVMTLCIVINTMCLPFVADDITID